MNLIDYHIKKYTEENDRMSEDFDTYFQRSFTWSKTKAKRLKNGRKYLHKSEEQMQKNRDKAKKQREQKKNKDD